MFDYDVMSEAEATQERYQLLPDGEYQAVCDSSIDKVSQNSGNPMMDIIWSVYDANGKTHPVRDFLVFTKSMMWKVIHCAESTDKLQEYKDKKFCSDIIRGASAILRIGTEKGSEIPEDKLKGKAPGARYPDRNKVEDYIVGSVSAKPAVVKDDSFPDDDIPF
jgi:hypothetical protein